MNLSDDRMGRLPRPDGNSIAYQRIPGKPSAAPGIVFCGGFRSDMTGTKAVALADACAVHGRAYTRFDYFGHGQSTGAFAEGTIGRWKDDTIAVLDQLTEGPQILVGSSMGGWLATLAALARPDRVAGLVLVAPALDFTQALIWARLDRAARERLQSDGMLAEPSAYAAEPTIITWRLVDEGRQHLLLDQPIPFAGPVEVLQGMHDADVPWRHALRTVEAFAGDNAVLTLVKDGDHRLSRPQDIARLIDAALRGQD